MKLIEHFKSIVNEFKGIPQGYPELTDQEIRKNQIPDRYKDNEQAMLIIKDVVDDMGQEIAVSLAGSRSTTVIDNPDKGQGAFKAINTSTKSTFPPFLHDAGFKSRKAFLSAVKNGKGKAWVRIALRAIQRLEHGTDPKNVHNQAEPDIEFMNLVVNPLPF